LKAKQCEFTLSVKTIKKMKMKTKLISVILIAFIFIIPIELNAQSWQLQTSGTTNALRHVHFVNTNTGWIVGHSGTVLKTTDGGNNWIKMPFSFTYTDLIGCYFVSETTGWVGGDIGVFKTTDGGNTWTMLSGPSGITKLYFTDENTGFAVGGTDGSSNYYGDIFKTTDGGNTWSKSSSTKWARFYGIQFIDANTGWAYAEINGLLVGTTDGGNVWNILQNFSPNLIRGISFIDKNNGWFAGRSNSSGLSMKTTNGGVSWTNIAGQLNFGLASIQMVSDKKGWATSGPAIMKTTDGGVSWTADYVGSVALGSTSMFFKDANHGWAVGESGTIIAYTNNSSAVSESYAEKHMLTVSSNNFNTPAKASYELEKSGFVKLAVYNTTGAEVQLYVNKWQEAGNYTLNLNLNELTKGVYLLKLSTGRHTETVKLVY
jgi:photosystem II stability/assembly factor-like uncharacterized protein